MYERGIPRTCNTMQTITDVGVRTFICLRVETSEEHILMDTRPFVSTDSSYEPYPSEWGGNVCAYCTQKHASNLKLETEVECAASHLFEATLRGFTD